MLKKIVKILLILIGSLTALIFLLLFAVWLGLLNGFIKNTIVSQANRNIIGELSIGELRGNLFSEFSLYNITLLLESDTLLFSGEAKIDYSLLPLLRNEIVIDLISLKDVNVKLEQETDSSWNFTKLVKENPEPDTTTSAGFNWKVSVNEFKARHLSASISSIDTSSMIPAYAETGFRIKAGLSGDTITARIDSLKVITRNPDFTMQELTGNFSKKADVIAWNDVQLQLVKSMLTSEGNYSSGKGGQAEAEVEIDPLAFDDLRQLLPDLPVYGSPRIMLHLEGNELKYDFKGSIVEDDQSIDLSGSLTEFRSNPGYILTIVMKNIDGSAWTGDEKMKTDISGELHVEGQGFNVKKNAVTLTGNFGKVSYDQYTLNNLMFNIRKDGNRVSGTMSSGTFAGDVSLRYDLSDVFGDPAYDIIAGYNNVDIGNLPGIDSLNSDLNGQIHVNGRGTSPEKIVARIEIKSDRSNIAGEPLGDFTLNADYNRGNFNLGLRDFGSPYFVLNAEGNGNLKSEGDIRFSLEPLDVTSLAEIFDMPAIGAAGKITGAISGNPDSLKAFATIVLDSIAYDTITVRDISSEITASLVEKTISSALKLNTGEISAGSFHLQSAEIGGEYSGENATTDISLAVSDSLQANFSGSVEGFENPLIRIRHIGIRYNGSEWATPHDSAFVMMNQDDISVNNFILSSGGQDIRADGRFSFKGDEDMSLEVNDLDLGSLPVAGFLPYEIAGILSSGFSLTGTAAQPVINSKISADGVEVNGFAIDSIRMSIAYDNDLLHLTGKVLTGLYESVNLSLDVPVSVSLSDSIALLSDNPGLKGSVQVDSLDLKKISGFLPTKDMSTEGFADIDIGLENTINDPVISGSFSLGKGSFRNKQFGIDYRDIQMFASIDSSTVGLDTLSLRTGKGRLAMNGYVSLENTDSLQMNDFRIKLNAKDFQAVESAGIELNFDSDLDLSGTLGNPGFKGGLDINSSKINIDYFSEFLSQKTDEPNPPLLIEALRDTLELNADTAAKVPFFSGTAFYKNLAGEVTVDIPGNTWVTGKDMNFELNGQVRAVKASENISLFGELNVKRGHYKIYGRNFDFERGKINFTGSSDFNPDVDFEIVYSFRDIEKELRELKLLVTGKLMQPSLRFMLGDEAIEEKDAISYIVFGKSVNQLGEGEREKISGQDVAMGAAVTQLSSVLKGVLQESAGVDVFEVTGGEDWKSGNVTIGKYITNNLFLSYERSFDFNKQSKTANTEKIMLEYQLLRNLLLKATNQEINSGFDLIWRKTWR